ncbi:hypothetical protein ADUPG1_004915, partial [Aduncisulcus paluster]
RHEFNGKVSFITGQGIHSSGPGCAIREAVMGLLQREHLEPYVDSGNKGTVNFYAQYGR